METLQTYLRVVLCVMKYANVYNTCPQAIGKKIRLTIVVTLMFIFSANQAAAQSKDQSYVVRPGDSIWKICQQLTDYPKCWLELASYNQIDESRPLSAHQRLNIPRQWLSNPAITANIIHVSGTARYQAKGKSLTPLFKGQKLLVGDSVSVDAGSVTIQFADGAVLLMEENTDITIDAMSVFLLKDAFKFDVRLPKGGVKVTVPKRFPKTQFNVRTPAGVAAVRGTEFRVYSGSNAILDNNILIKSEVLEGEVEVSSQGVVQIVSAGFAVSATEASPLSQAVQLIKAPKWNFSCSDPGYVEWQNSSKAEQYNLVLMEDDDQVDKVLQTVALEGSHYTFKNLADRCYQVRVNAVDDSSYRGLEAQRKLCYTRYLTQPLLGSATLTKNDIQLNWAPVEYATGYVVELSKDEDFTDIIASKVFDVNDVQWHFDKNISSVFIRVKAESDSLNDSAFSKISYVEVANHRHRWMGLLSSIFAILII